MSGRPDLRGLAEAAGEGVEGAEGEAGEGVLEGAWGHWMVHMAPYTQDTGAPAHPTQNLACQYPTCPTDGPHLLDAQNL